MKTDHTHRGRIEADYSPAGCCEIPETYCRLGKCLTLVAKGLPMEDFMADIENMVSELIHTYHEVSDEQKKMFAQEQTVSRTCRTAAVRW